MTEPVSLIKKLQLHSGERVVLINVPEEYAEMLTAGAEIEPVPPSEDYESAIAFCENPAEAAVFAQRIVPGLPSDGAFWLGYRKANAGEEAESGDDVWWRAMDEMGFTPVRAVAVDEKWTCLGFISESAKEAAGEGKGTPAFYGF